MDRTKPTKLCYRAVEFRATQDHGDGRTLEGYAAVFDTPTRIESWEGIFDEVVARGAFKRTLNGRKPVLQFDHGRDARTGSVPIGSIEEIREDEHGLFVRARLFDNDVVEPIRQAIEGGAIDGMSFRFKVVRDEWRDKDGKLVKDSELLDLLWNPGDRGPLQRSIREVELFEAGPVVFPAYEATTVGVRSLLANLTDSERDALMRDLASELRQPDSEPGHTATSPTPAVTSDAAVRHSDPQEPATPGTSAVNTPTERNTIMADTMTVEERGARQSEIRARLAEIDSEWNGAALPEEVRTEWDSLNAEYDEHSRAITETSERRQRIHALAEHTGGERVDNARAGYGRGPEVIRKAENIYDLGEIRNRASSIDELPRLYRDNAMRAVETARFPGAKDRSAAQSQVERLLDSVDDENGTLARRILVTGSPTYDRAFGKAMTALSTNGLTAEEQRALALGTGSAGGYAVPFQLDPTVILTSNGQVDPIRQIARVEQIVGKEWQGVTSAGITVSRAAEAAEAADDSPTLAQPTVKPTRVQGFVPFSVEVDQDWTALRSEITMMLGEAKAEEEATSFVLGNGTGDNPHGVVATLNTSSHVDAVGEGIAVADLYAVEEALPPRFRARGQWLANRSIYNKVRQLDTQGGANLWVRLDAGLPPELIGYAAHEASAMDGTIDPAAAGTHLVLLFGDFSKFLIVDRVGMEVELVPHLFGANRRPTGQRGIYAIWRNSSKILTDNAFRLLKVTTAV
ncbi:hypothetical protein BAY59_24320 [Prauserella coralliicola]|nr:hypothetical protein BAY59_24320 [Prauserella coralliicola]